MKVKALADSRDLPDEVKNGVPKPDISEEERAALHNVTSGLYNQQKVRSVVEKAVADICRSLHVSVPDRKAKIKKSDKKSDTAARKDPEDQPVDRTAGRQPKTEKKGQREDPQEDHKDTSPSEVEAGSEDDETEWGGLSDAEDDEKIVAKEEKVLSGFDDRLGGSDDEEFDTANEELDPMEITDVSESEDEEDDAALNTSGSGEDALEDSEAPDEEDSDSDSSAVSPPPKVRKESKKAAQTKSKDTQFLPSLMGGYISGSESEASDIDVAPPARKNRRGQKARQAIWEKKFKAEAKHLAKQKAGRDDGWDLKRGAVDGSEKTPWKQGIKTLFGKRAGNNQGGEPAESSRRPKARPKKDNEGPLHPSWEAKKKAKEQQQTAAFQGKRVVFD